MEGRRKRGQRRGKGERAGRKEGPKGGREVSLFLFENQHLLPLAIGPLGILLRRHWACAERGLLCSLAPGTC